MDTITIETIAESYLDTLAFAESPESQQQAGPFDAGRYRAVKSAKKLAAARVRVFVEQAMQAGIDLDDADLSDVGHKLALVSQGHGCGFGDDDNWSGEHAAKLDAIADDLGEVYCAFRVYAGRYIAMSIEGGRV